MGQEFATRPRQVANHAGQSVPTPPPRLRSLASQLENAADCLEKRIEVLMQHGEKLGHYLPESVATCSAAADELRQHNLQGEKLDQQSVPLDLRLQRALERVHQAIRTLDRLSEHLDTLI